MHGQMHGQMHEQMHGQMHGQEFVMKELVVINHYAPHSAVSAIGGSVAHGNARTTALLCHSAKLIVRLFKERADQILAAWSYY
jgi:hypothetical protein